MNRLHFVSLGLGIAATLSLGCLAKSAAEPSSQSGGTATEERLTGLGYIGSDDPDAARIDQALRAAHERYADLDEGANADYIPVLAEVDPELFAIALVTVDGDVHVVGDGEARFSIQSISKVFTMAQVMAQSGPEVIFDGVGVDATGRPFNSIVAVEEFQGHQMNALVNPGAITATSLVAGDDADAIFESVRANLSAWAARELDLDQPVCESELATNQRNRAIGALMHAYGLIDEHHARAVEVYTKQCAMSVDAKDLAVMAATLANGGKNPVSGEVLLDVELVPKVLAVMATAGLYDDSGQWLYHCGLPAKSGVGGGILAVAPGRFGIAAFSPRLDPAGNSVRAQKAIIDVVRDLEANPYRVEPR